MSYIETAPLKNSTIMMLHAEKGEIELSPSYQRLGGVWNTQKKQLLIDSILNDYDIPKIYFHLYEREKRDETGCNYAVIDGRQRLETIWSFMEGAFTLSSDFVYQKDENIKLASLSYADIAKEYPRIKVQFDSFVLPVVTVSTTDEELIEDMFSRLNEAVPLNAAEKRNALGGFAVQKIRETAEHDFFRRNVRFGNKRYQFYEISARLLFTEYNISIDNRIVDTKKIYLDSFVITHKNESLEIKNISSTVLDVLGEMSSVFTDKDELLQSQGNMVLYYLLFRTALRKNELGKITRKKFFEFREKLKSNRDIAEAGDDYGDASYELLEYDRLTQQGTNDSSNIKERFSILSREFYISDDLFS